MCFADTRRRAFFKRDLVMYLVRPLKKKKLKELYFVKLVNARLIKKGTRLKKEFFFNHIKIRFY